MPLGSTQNTIAESYSDLKRTSKQAYDIADRSITYLHGAAYWNYLTTQLIPALRSCLAALPDSSNFPVEWISALSDYAATQTLTPSQDFKADYDALRLSISEAITESVELLPKSGGKVTIQSFDSSGVETVDQIGSLQTLIAKLEAIKAAA